MADLPPLGRAQECRQCVGDGGQAIDSRVCVRVHVWQSSHSGVEGRTFGSL